MLQVRCAHPAGTGEPWNLPNKRWNGEGGQPLSPPAVPAPPFAPKRLFKPFRCYGRLIFRKEYTVLFAPKRSTSRFAALTLRVTSHRNVPLGHSGVAHGLFSFRTITPNGAPVFRSAYSASRNARASAAFTASIKPHRGLISKTLDLQVRCANPTGRGELRIHPPPFPAGAGTSEKEMRRKTEGRSAEKLLK